MRESALAALVLSLLACGSTSEGRDALARHPTLIEQPPLSTPRATHAQVRTENAVLLIGGCVRDGCEAGPGSRTVDIVRSGETIARSTGLLLEPRVQPNAAALLGGKVLVIGGWVDGRVSASTEVFDPGTRSSRLGPVMTEARTGASVVRLADGRVLIAGGHDGTRATSSAELYNPATGELMRTGHLLTARAGATTTLLPDGRVLIVGGAIGARQGSRVLASAEIYDPDKGSFSPAGELSQRRYKHGAALLASGDVVIVGGSDERDYGGKLRSVERYDFRRGRFVNGGSLVEARFKLADAVVPLPSGKVLVVGGAPRPELFDPATGNSTLLNFDLGGWWNYLTAASLDNNGVFLAGGYSEGKIRVTDRNWILRL